MLQQHLVIAEEHVALGQEHIARQIATIAKLKRGGHNTAIAEDLLVVFEESQRLHLAGRDGIIAELARA